MEEMDMTELLVTALQSKTLTRDLYHKFEMYLRPIVLLKQEHQQDSNGNFEPLMEQFGSFLSDALSTLSSLFKEVRSEICDENPNKGLTQERVEIFLDIYKLTIDCIIPFQPFYAESRVCAIHLEWLHFVSILKACGKYTEAESEAAVLLEDLRSVLVGANIAVWPEIRMDYPNDLPAPYDIKPDDSVITLAFINIIVCFIDCVGKTNSTLDDAYTRIIKLVQQVQPWIEILDDKHSTKYRLFLYASLCECTDFLIREYASFHPVVARDFYFTFLNHCSKISLENLASIAVKISHRIENSSLFLDVIGEALKLFTCELKVETVEIIEGLLKLLAHSCSRLCDADECKAASRVFSQHIDKIDEVSCICASFLSLYSLALRFKFETPGQIGNETSCRGLLQKLSKSVATVTSYSYLRMSNDAFHEKAISLMLLLDALDYTYDALVGWIDEIWDRFREESRPSFDKSSLGFILCVLRSCTLHHTAFSRMKSYTQKEKMRLNENQKSDRLGKALSRELIISFISDDEVIFKTITDFLSSHEITSQEVETFHASLSIIVREMYRMREFDKAIVALRLCCEASGSYINMIEKSKDGTRETMVSAYKMVKFNIDNLSNCDSKKECNCSKGLIFDTTLTNLVKLITVEDLHGIQSSSYILLETWVKVICREYGDGGDGDDASIPIELFVSQGLPSPQTRDRILSDVLRACESIGDQFPNLSKKMTERLQVILSNKVGIGAPLEISKYYIRRARFYRACGIGHLEKCLDDLSYAINELTSQKIADCGASHCHQLASTHCLRAQCIQEKGAGDQNLKEMLKDIRLALQLWYECIKPSEWGVFGSNRDKLEVPSKDILVLLFSMIDLLSIKGCFQLHSQIYELISKIFQNDGLSLDEQFALLWTNRRLGHSICGSEIDLGNLDNFLPSIRKPSLDCKNDDLHLYLFLQSLFSNHLVCEISKNDFQKLFGGKGGVEGLNNIASSLASKKDSVSLFFAGYAYYDLSQWLLSECQLIEALSYARESSHLRTEVLRKKFFYSQNHEKGEELHLEVKGADIIETWPGMSRFSHTKDSSFLSPWIVL
ncbi:hypothetical protein LUZ60_013498 [Juncus effusus]|nr:hypothetical protein LUZ60_013498 [Juncus effusus]